MKKLPYDYFRCTGDIPRDTQNPFKNMAKCEHRQSCLRFLDRAEGAIFLTFSMAVDHCGHFIEAEN